MRTPSPLVLLLLPLSLSCSEYEFIGGAGEAGGEGDTAGDGGTGGSGLPGDCGDFANYPDETVELNDECDVELSEGSFTPVVEWQYGTSAFCGPPVAGQIVDSNSNGALDSADMPVIVLYQSNKVIALYGDGSGEAWRAQGRSYGQDGGFAIGDVDEDGWPDVITASNNMVCALDGNTGTELWCATGLSSSLDAMGYSYPSIADLNADGHPEVIVGSAIMRGSDGQVLGQGTRGIGAAPYGGVPSSTYGAMSAAVDLDGDGTAEVITGNAAYDHTGAVVWTNTGLDGLVAVADFDGDGEGEIVKTSGIYVTGMETDGTEVWGPLTYSGNLGAPAVDDLDGDGTPDFVFAAQNKLVAMKWGGTVMWQANISDASGAAGPTLFDFEMDGYPEVLYADEQSIQFFSGVDGSVKFRSTSHASYTILETPIVADVDNDGQVEIVLGHCQGNASIGAITIYGDADESWPQGRKVWNQHGYQITNIDDDGGVPSPTNNNWPLYNSFRSGDVGRAPSEYWDLRGEVLDVCEEECDRGNVYVIGRVRNAGNIEAPAGIEVSLRAGGGGEIIGTAVTTRVTAPGETGEILSFTAASDDISGKRPVVTADEDAFGYGAVYECDESNNAGTWNAAVCE